MNRIASMAISIIIIVASWGEVSAANLRLAQAAVCGDLGVFRAKLERDWGETPYAAGISAAGPMMHIFVNQRTQTWTMLITTASQTSCVTAHGTDWIHVPMSVPERRTKK